MRILIVEDDALLGRGIQAGLNESGFAADWVRDGEQADAALAATGFAAMVLDLGLPRLSGLELLRRLRQRGDRTPVLVLTARDAIEDRIRGLDTGADDYMTKPFDLHELAARLRALVRRASGSATPVIEAAGVTLDPATREVRFRGAPVELSGREFDVLRELMLAAGRVLSRDQIVERVYAAGEDVESNAIEVHIHHLRRKLAPELIRTLRGVGYLMPRKGAAKP
jgi:DNA-binding response OmpR family regulator